MKKIILFLMIILGFFEPKNMFITVTPKEAIEIIETGTGILIFESDECPWCNKARPVLESIARKNDIQIYSANIQSIKSQPKEGKKGTAEYTKILELLDPYLDEYLDEEGNSYGEKRVYIPDVYAIKNGKIMGHHLGTVDSHTDYNNEITDEQEEELEQIYQSLIDSIV